MDLEKKTEKLSKFSYIATNPSSGVVRGELRAIGEGSALLQLERLGLDPISVSEKKESLILCASSHGRKHNIFGLWSLDLYDKLQDDLINKKVRKVQDWTEKNKIKNLEFKFKDYDPFFNINTQEDLEFAKKLSTRIKNEQK